MKWVVRQRHANVSVVVRAIKLNRTGRIPHTQNGGGGRSNFNRCFRIRLEAGIIGRIAPTLLCGNTNIRVHLITRPVTSSATCVLISDNIGAGGSPASCNPSRNRRGCLNWKGFHVRLPVDKVIYSYGVSYTQISNTSNSSKIRKSFLIKVR